VKEAKERRISTKRARVRGRTSSLLLTGKKRANSESILQIKRIQQMSTTGFIKIEVIDTGM
jgi:hypothetical protein